ncbi:MULTISPECIES: TRAP transporter small permease subunit [Rhodomicrobium]|uniref:TRAP transporter small permease subunit n=1 Tax=Rhodomicrobium TaxID=1068 RepID=UPI000B4A83CC|nr:MULTISPECIES: TRAP transporter small permease subunit [Rhodomicrobium]
MRRALALADAIDAVTEWIGQVLKWLVLIASLVSAGNALIRYGFNQSSNAWLEAQWYMFAAMFLLAAGYALKHDEHVRVDVLFTNYSVRRKAMVDIFGLIFFLLPTAIVIADMSIPMIVNSIKINEMSSDPGGLLRWPVKLLIPLGFILLAIQAVAELIKKIAIVKGLRTPVKHYERPVQ